jgi:hypothetical protein
MGVQTTTLKKEATSIAVTGGTDLAYTPDGVSIANGVHLAAASVTDFRVRPSITLKTRNPSLVNGEFTKGKRWLTLTMPRILASGAVVYDVGRIDIEVHPETPVANQNDMVFQLAQMLFDSDLSLFISTGSLA